MDGGTESGSSRAMRASRTRPRRLDHPKRRRLAPRCPIPRRLPLLTATPLARRVVAAESTARSEKQPTLWAGGQPETPTEEQRLGSRSSLRA
jgi:hypothetical protein